MGRWNGKRAAISLTFDDGLPCQIEHALPLLRQFGMPGTFFLIQNSVYDTEFRTDAWKQAIADGNEIGSHSVNHRKAADLSPMDAVCEAADSQQFLVRQLGVPIESFCYPYTDAPEHLQRPVSQLYKQARGGRVARADKFIDPRDRNVNLFNTPCFHVGPGCLLVDPTLIPSWIAEAVEREAWLTLMLHGVGPDETQWDNISSDMFAQLLEWLKHPDVWVATFGAAAENFRKDRGW